MVPKMHSTQQIGKALSSKDLQTLNSIPNVQFTKKDDFGVNDLILELSNFVDEEVINRVELQLMSGKLQEDWSLPKDFQILETRNKEISLTLNELEEVAWRMSG